jgi:7-cyano-7-deazaguanine synthase
MPTAIVLLSGGMDSATALYWALQQGFTVQAVTVNYRGRAAHERRAARRLAARAGVPCREVALPFLASAADLREATPDALAGLTVPEGYLPARNLLFYALAAYYAEVLNADVIVGGHVKSDAEGFPDATPAFFQDVERLISASQLMQGDRPKRVRLRLPFLAWSKTEVAALALRLGVPLDLTWSCYYDRDAECGACEACQEQREAVRRARAAR